VSPLYGVKLKFYLYLISENEVLNRERPRVRHLGLPVEPRPPINLYEEAVLRHRQQELPLQYIALRYERGLVVKVGIYVEVHEVQVFCQYVI
jgi:hypothetical protein